jgi:hypothetical protein
LGKRIAKSNRRERKHLTNSQYVCGSPDPNPKRKRGSKANAEGRIKNGESAFSPASFSLFLTFLLFDVLPFPSVPPCLRAFVPSCLPFSAFLRFCVSTFPAGHSTHSSIQSPPATRSRRFGSIKNVILAFVKRLRIARSVGVAITKSPTHVGRTTRIELGSVPDDRD